MTIVRNADELMKALQAATGGETILLAPGSYGALRLDAAKHPWIAYAQEVTLRSADPDRPASFSSAEVAGARNMTFESLLFDYDPPPGRPTLRNAFEFVDSKNITFRDSVFDGALATGVSAAEDGYGTGRGIVLSKSSDVLIEDSVIRDFRIGVVVMGENIVLRGNDISGIREDGLRVFSAHDLLVENNHIHDFRRASGSGDHPDMIQVYTKAGSLPSSNLTFRGNVFDSGVGDTTQSLYMGNNIADPNDKAGTFYQGVVVEENVIRNGQGAGISIAETVGVVVRNNTVLSNPNAVRDTVNEPIIRVSGNSENVTIVNNIAARIHEVEKASWEVGDNFLVQNASAADANHYADVFVNANAGGLARLADLQLLPGLEVDAGATVTAYDATPDGLVALMRQPRHQAADKPMTFVFDASLSAGPKGALTEASARFVWNFGDGATATGLVVTHTYAEPGTYAPTLTVIAADGSRDVAQTRLTASGVVDGPVFGVVGGGPKVFEPAYDAPAIEGPGLKFDLGVVNGAVVDEAAPGRPIAVVDTATGDKENLLLTAGREGRAILFDDATRVTVNHEDAGFLFDRDAISLVFGLRAANGAATDAGELLTVRRAYTVEVTSNGEVRATLTTDAGSFGLVTAKAGLLDGAWHDVVLTYDSAATWMSVHVDGTYVGGGVARGRIVTDPGYDVYIGSGGAASFEGAIDHVGVYGHALSKAEIANLGVEFVPVPDPWEDALLFLMVENRDLVDLGPEPTPVIALNLVSGARDELDLTAGRDGRQALVLDDAHRYVVKKDDVGYLFDQDTFTFAFGVRASGAESAGDLMTIKRGYDLDITAAGEVRLAMSTTAGTFVVETQGARMLEGQWRDVAVIYDDGRDSLSVLVDGEILGSAFATGRTAGAQKWDMFLGQAWGSSADGALDFFAFYDRALTTQELDAYIF